MTTLHYSADSLVGLRDGDPVLRVEPSVQAPTVAALFVSRRGPYWNRLDVDAFDERRDARTYTGNLPAVLHPPCASWCRLAGMREAVYGYKRGDDGGCFESALATVRRVGGCLEHPAWSRAWTTYGLPIPHGTGWSRCFFGREWVCEVAQSAYGHRATKLTWLFYVGDNPPAPLLWKRPKGTAVISGAHFNGGRKNPRPSSERVWPAEASRTPVKFAEALLSLARLSREVKQ